MTASEFVFGSVLIFVPSLSLTSAAITASSVLGAAASRLRLAGARRCDAERERGRALHQIERLVGLPERTAHVGPLAGHHRGLPPLPMLGQEVERPLEVRLRTLHVAERRVRGGEGVPPCAVLHLLAAE